MQTMLEEDGHAPNMVSQFEVHAPQALVHMQRKCSEGSNHNIEIEQDHVSLF